MTCARFDCIREIVNIDVSANEEAVRSLLMSGGRIFLPYRKACIVCESLDIISFYNNSIEHPR
jgi:hypothetical protein